MNDESIMEKVSHRGTEGTKLIVIESLTALVIYRW